MYNREAERIVIARLINWGLWSRFGGIPKLDYPAWIDIMREFFPAECYTIPDEIDAQHMESIISTLDIIGRRGKGWGEVYKHILLMEYRDFGRPQEAKAENIRDRFKTRCSIRTYQYHFYRVKRAIHYLSSPV